MIIKMEFKEDEIVIALPNDCDSQEYLDVFKTVNNPEFAEKLSQAIKEQAFNQLEKKFETERKQSYGTR